VLTFAPAHPLQLEELMKLHKSKPSDDDHWRAFSYGKCTSLTLLTSPKSKPLTSWLAIRAIRNYPKRITSYSQARTIRGVGEKTALKVTSYRLPASQRRCSRSRLALKIMEIFETGELRRIGYEKTEDVAATNLFQGIYGVGTCTQPVW
jgi:DNA polymerase lambda